MTQLRNEGELIGGMCMTLITAEIFHARSRKIHLCPVRGGDCPNSQSDTCISVLMMEQTHFFYLFISRHAKLIFALFDRIKKKTAKLVFKERPKPVFFKLF